MVSEVWDENQEMIEMARKFDPHQVARDKLKGYRKRTKKSLIEELMRPFKEDFGLPDDVMAWFREKK